MTADTIIVGIVTLCIALSIYVGVVSPLVYIVSVSRGTLQKCRDPYKFNKIIDPDQPYGVTKGVGRFISAVYGVALFIFLVIAVIYLLGLLVTAL